MAADDRSRDKYIRAIDGRGRADGAARRDTALAAPTMLAAVWPAPAGRRLHNLASSVIGPAAAPTAAASPATPPQDPELAVEDFSFEGTLGSAGTTLRRVGRNHFVATLGAAPNHPEWCNKIQFTIAQHALGNALRLEVEFPSPAMSLNESV